MFFGDKKKAGGGGIAILLAPKAKKMKEHTSSTMEEDHDDEYAEMESAAVEEVFAAIEEKDMEMFTSAFKSYHDILHANMDSDDSE